MDTKESFRFLSSGGWLKEGGKSVEIQETKSRERLFGAGLQLEGPGTEAEEVVGTVELKDLALHHIHHMVTQNAFEHPQVEPAGM